MSLLVTAAATTMHHHELLYYPVLSCGYWIADNGFLVLTALLKIQIKISEKSLSACPLIAVYFPTLQEWHMIFTLLYATHRCIL